MCTSIIRMVIHGRNPDYLCQYRRTDRTANNPNVSNNIKSLSNLSFLPFMKKYLADRHFTNFIYSPGGPPGINYIRYSTFDINDGPAEFWNSELFFIYTGRIDGKEYSAENLKHRAEGQMTGMRCCLNLLT